MSRQVGPVEAGRRRDEFNREAREALRPPADDSFMGTQAGGWGSGFRAAVARELRVEWAHFATPANLQRPEFGPLTRTYHRAMATHDLDLLEATVEQARRIAGGAL